MAKILSKKTLLKKKPPKKKPQPYKERSDDSKLVSKPSGFNNNLTYTNNAFMRKLLGEPRVKKDYTQDDKGLTNGTLKKLIITDDVGPFRATGLKQAVESLTDIMADIEDEQPVIYAKLGTAGMLCVRNVRGSSTSVSNHSWGTAIDLKIDGLLDIRGDNKTQNGLMLIASIFNKHKWYWGKSFPTEDSMHFEVSKEKLEEWFSSKKPIVRDHELRAKQAIDQKSRPATALRVHGPILKRGDNGAAVKQLQEKLNSARAMPKLQQDCSFGQHTEDAVKYFQRKNHLKVNGVVDEDTQEALGMIRTSSSPWYEQISRKFHNFIAGR